MKGVCGGAWAGFESPHSLFTPRDIPRDFPMTPLIPLNIRNVLLCGHGSSLRLLEISPTEWFVCTTKYQRIYITLIIFSRSVTKLGPSYRWHVSECTVSRPRVNLQPLAVTDRGQVNSPSLNSPKQATCEETIRNRLLSS